MSITHELQYEDSVIRGILEQTQTIALVGASNKKHRASYRVMKFLQSKDYRVIPVNPKLKGSELLGETVYESLADVPVPVDMVDIFRNPTAAGFITDEAIAIAPKVIWMQLDIINTRAALKAETAGIKVIMDRCPKIEYARLNINETSASNTL